MNADFAPGKKTITGVALFLVPIAAQFFGYSIDAGSITELVSEGFTLFGFCLSTYGLLMKFVRKFKSSFKK